uniref:Uncharacterized protein n=1 Tax=Anguilla anguilla TaxID=7936 RepID=A0A0E9QQS0_ANGAN
MELEARQRPSPTRPPNGSYNSPWSDRKSLAFPMDYRE